MKALDIRTRMLLAALLPLALISVLLSVWALMSRSDDLQIAYEQRNHLVARQIGMASEYGLFSGNRTQLQALVVGALLEADVRWVAIVDRQGQVLASGGDSALMPSLDQLLTETHGSLTRQPVDYIRQPVFPSNTPLEEVFDGAIASTPPSRVSLGQVVVSFSRQALNDRKRNLLLVGGLIVSLTLLFGMALAVWLSRGVLRPIMQISQLVEQIGRGEFDQARERRGALSRDDPLYDLQVRVHQMSEQLRLARDELQQQVELATQKLREKKEEAEAANLAKTRFLAAASHDLRQPTHALGLFVSRLSQLDHDVQTRQLVSHLEASVLALQNLLDGLLDISRLEAHGVPVNERPFAMATLLDQLSKDLSDVARAKGLVLQIRPSTAWVRSDATLVYRIVLNLVNNAIRYTQRGRVLVVARAYRSCQQLKIQVWDTGVGIAPEHHQAVFGEFFQVSNAARDRTKGLGLGLSIVQRTADLLGLAVHLRSRLGLGTCVTVTLPLVEADPNALAVGATEDSTPLELTGVDVLVIEDDALASQALTVLLQGWGMRVFEAGSLAQALEQMANGWVPGVIISDYRLQDEVNGIEAIESLRRELNVGVAACLMSGDSQPSLAQQAQEAGLTLLQKPVRPAKLRSLLRRLLA
ncbi:MAG: ATP-binding protein [Rhodoferax sp.]|nr:ATP-binding protein [Rhodoferax sp.]